MGIGTPRALISSNVVAFLPSPGAGFVYGTNRGNLQICRMIGASAKHSPSRDSLCYHRSNAEHRRALFFARNRERDGADGGGGGTGSEGGAGPAGRRSGIDALRHPDMASTSGRDDVAERSPIIRRRAATRSRFRSRHTTLVEPWNLEVRRDEKELFLPVVLSRTKIR